MNRFIWGWAAALSFMVSACEDDVPFDATDASTRDAANEDAGRIEPIEVDRSEYTDVGTDSPLDYSDMGMWACHPWLADNECHAVLDATDITSDSGRELETHLRAEAPSFDCFYVYPTVLLSGEPNMTDFSEESLALVSDPLLAQAARFSSQCEIYAPLYRQAGLAGGTFAVGADEALGFRDVRDAFAYYLEHHNHGRKFVLLGHSQGTMALTELIQMQVDDVPEVRERMLSAILLGGEVEVPMGATVGGSFEHIPTCETPGQTGCVMAFVSFPEEAPPTEGSAWAVASTEDHAVACTDPATLADNAGAIAGSYYPLQLHNPVFQSDVEMPEDLETPFVVYRDVLHSRCVQGEGVSYLEISTDLATDDPRLPPYRVLTVEGFGWGLHLTDYNNVLGDLMQAVALQAESAGL